MEKTIEERRNAILDERDRLMGEYALLEDEETRILKDPSLDEKRRLSELKRLQAEYDSIADRLGELSEEIRNLQDGPEKPLTRLKPEERYVALMQEHDVITARYAALEKREAALEADGSLSEADRTAAFADLAEQYARAARDMEDLTKRAKALQNEIESRKG